jgi:hypothetical protein
VRALKPGPGGPSPASEDAASGAVRPA